MNVQMVQFTVDPADVADVEQAAEIMCVAIEQERPVGTRFAVCKLADGVTFLNILQLADGVTNPLPAIGACRAFAQRMPGWARSAPPPAPTPVIVVGSHGMFEPIEDGVLPDRARS